MYSVGYVLSSAAHFFKSDDTISLPLPLAMTALADTFIFYYFLCFFDAIYPFLAVKKPTFRLLGLPLFFC